MVIFLEFPVCLGVFERRGMRFFGVELQFYILTTAPYSFSSHRTAKTKMPRSHGPAVYLTLISPGDRLAH